MDENGSCKVCPSKCNWKRHQVNNYRWVYKESKTKHTLQQLKDRFQTASKAINSVQDLITKFKEYDDCKEYLVMTIDLATQAINRLKEIALKPNPLSALQYIELIIETEKSEARPEWEKRCKTFESIKENAQIKETLTCVTPLNNFKAKPITFMGSKSL